VGRADFNSTWVGVPLGRFPLGLPRFCTKYTSLKKVVAVRPRRIRKSLS